MNSNLLKKISVVLGIAKSGIALYLLCQSADFKEYDKKFGRKY